MTNIVVGFPMVNAGELYVNGLHLVYIGNTSITVTAGACRDSTNQDDIVLAADTTLSIASNGVNALDTGTVAANTFYYVYAIGSSLSATPEINIDKQYNIFASGTTILNGTVIAEGQNTPQPAYTVTNNQQPATLLSASNSAPTLPAGYDMFRRVGTVLTDGSSHILAFWQDQTGQGTNRKMWYDAPISVLAATAAATFTAQALNVAVPAIACGTTGTEVQLQADLDPNAAADFVEIRPTGSTAAAGNVKMSGDVAAVHHFDQLQVVAWLNAASPKQPSIDWLTDAASTVALTVSAYIDKL
jgi:hypothetical protein